MNCLTFLSYRPQKKSRLRHLYSDWRIMTHERKEMLKILPGCSWLGVECRSGFLCLCICIFYFQNSVVDNYAKETMSINFSRCFTNIVSCGECIQSRSTHICAVKDKFELAKLHNFVDRAFKRL
jgi:hypothetical protein